MELKKISYRHEALIDELITDPTISQRDLARKFKYTETWISLVMSSDGFKAALAKRRKELTDPILFATVEEQLEGLARQSAGIIAEKLEETRNPTLAIKALELSSRALGMGARDKPTTQINNYVALMPPKAKNTQAWLEQVAADKLPVVIDAVVVPASD